jgi:rhamnulose-1-phosphate aldolase/alcohol dehydrogenase
MTPPAPLADARPGALPDEVAALLGRSNRLGSDVRVTNFGGGNTSAKLDLPDPVTGETVRVLAVKGSGGDLGTLTADGLALLDVDRLRALEALYAGGVHEDDLVERYAACVFGTGGAVPSIDTPLHAFVSVAHVDHLHPDAVIALATAADGETLVGECFGGGVAWLDWKRPGFVLGLALRDLQRHRPDAVGAVMGGHGVISWAETSDACEARSLALIARAEAFLAERGSARPFGSVRPGFEPLTPEARAAQAAALGPVVRGVAASERPLVGHFDDGPEVLELLAGEKVPALAALGTSCPDHFLRTKVRPLLVDLPAGAALDEKVAELRRAHEQYRAGYRTYYEAHADGASPAMRGADPVVVLVPGVGMWSFGPDAAGARVAGEFYRNAVHVMRGAESVSSYEPIDDAEKFAVEYWELEERKLRMRPAPPALQGRVAVVTGGGSGIGKAIAERLAAAGAAVAVLDLVGPAAEKVAEGIGRDAGLGLEADVADEASVAAAFAAACRRWGGVDLVVNNAGFATSASLVDTTVEDFDRLHAVLARGSFLVSREAARIMGEQGLGGDIVYVVSKNAIVAGPANVAYGAAKADQAHQVRLLAAELGTIGVRVNGVNPDGVVRGSGIFSGDWLSQRADAYGVAPEDLGEHYASRTLLGEEVLPEHVADAVFALVGGDLSRTTGLLVPVDGGLPAAFLR